MPFAFSFPSVPCTQDKVSKGNGEAAYINVLPYLPRGLTVLPREAMDYVDSVQVWSLDQKHLHHLGLLEMQNPRPLHRPTESETGSRAQKSMFSQALHVVLLPANIGEPLPWITTSLEV